MSLYRTYVSGISSLLTNYNSSEIYLDSISSIRQQRLLRIYNISINSYWWDTFKSSNLNFDFVLFFRFISNFKLVKNSSRSTYLDLVSRINKTYPLVTVTFLGQTLIEKLFPVFERCIWLFVPYDARSVWGVQVILLWL